VSSGNAHFHPCILPPPPTPPRNRSFSVSRPLLPLVITVVVSSSSSSPSPSLRARNNNNGGRRWLQSIWRPAADAIYTRAYIILYIYIYIMYMERANVSINSEFPQQYIYIFIFRRRNCIFFTLYILFLTHLSFFSTSFLRTYILIYIYKNDLFLPPSNVIVIVSCDGSSGRQIYIYIYMNVYMWCAERRKELLRNLKLWFIFFHRNYVVVYIYTYLLYIYYMYIMYLSEIGTSVAHSFYYRNLKYRNKFILLWFSRYYKVS